MKTTKKSIVFCHGIWADGSCFNKVIPTLQAEGYEVMSAQYGLDTNEDDVAAVKRTLGRVGSPAILVGTLTAGRSLLQRARMSESWDWFTSLHLLQTKMRRRREKFSASDIFSHIEVAEGRVWMKPEGVASFAGDLPEPEQKVVWATHFAPAAELFNKNATGFAWKSKPSWYIVATSDRTVRPELQRFAAERMGATIREVNSSHVPMLSKPEVVIDVIRAAANA